MYKSLSLFIIICTSFFICSKQLSWFAPPNLLLTCYFSLFPINKWQHHAFSYSNQKPRFHFYCLLSWSPPNWPARFACSTSELYLQSSIHVSSSLTTSLGKYRPTSPSMSILELLSKSTFHLAARTCVLSIMLLSCLTIFQWYLPASLTIPTSLLWFTKPSMAWHLLPFLICVLHISSWLLMLQPFSSFLFSDKLDYLLP